MFKVMKIAGFNVEDAHLNALHRIEKLLLLVIIAFVWYYNIGELAHRKFSPPASSSPTGMQRAYFAMVKTQLRKL